MRHDRETVHRTSRMVQPNPRLEAQTRTIDELATLLDEFDSNLRDAAARIDHADILEGEAMGGRYRFAAGAVITHVTTHGFHHRAQAINMLRQLGQDNIPDVSILRWMMAVDGRA